MIGLPKVLKTKNDYLRSHALALSVPNLRDEMAKNWQGLVDAQYQWVISKVKPSTAAGKPNYKIMPGQDGEPESVFKNEKIAASELTLLGFTEAEVIQLISELES